VRIFESRAAATCQNLTDRREEGRNKPEEPIMFLVQNSGKKASALRDETGV
jgi:hypothetical protein